VRHQFEEEEIEFGKKDLEKRERINLKGRWGFRLKTSSVVATNKVRSEEISSFERE